MALWLKAQGTNIKNEFVFEGYMKKYFPEIMNNFHND